MVGLLSVSGSFSRGALLTGLVLVGNFGALSACKNQPPPAAEATAAEPPPPAGPAQE